MSCLTKQELLKINVTKWIISVMISETKIILKDCFILKIWHELKCLENGQFSVYITPF